MATTVETKKTVTVVSSSSTGGESEHDFEERRARAQKYLEERGGLAGHAQPERNLVITRSASARKSGFGAGGSSSSSSSGVRSAGGSAGAAFLEGNYSLVTAQGVNEVRASRAHEKTSLADLNDRFAVYLDKVRNLEAQNRKLADDLEKLRSKWGKETSQIKALYQAELDDARQLLNVAEREKARLEIRVASIEEQIEETRVKLSLIHVEITNNKDVSARQAHKISGYQQEIVLLRKQLDGLEAVKAKDQSNISTLEALLVKTRADLDEETLAHIDAENRRQTLAEEIEFLKSVHDKEVKELADLAYRDSSAGSSEFWKNELAQAVREIEGMYNEKLEGMKGDLEGYYNQKLQEFRTGAARQSSATTQSKEETKDLRGSITELREKINSLDAQNQALQRQIEQVRREKDETERDWESQNALLRDQTHGLSADLNAVLLELEGLIGTKTNLDLEIASYRKLLEFEESRSGLRIGGGGAGGAGGAFGAGGAGGAGGAFGAGGGDGEQGSFGSGEMSAKTTYSRTAKGSLSITDCPPDGRFIRLENTGKKEKNLSGYKIHRIIDGKKSDPYVLGSQFAAFRAGQKITIWTKGNKPSSAPAQDFEIDLFTWGVGSTATTSLHNVEGEEQSSLVQRTVYL